MYIGAHSLTLGRLPYPNTIFENIAKSAERHTAVWRTRQQSTLADQQWAVGSMAGWVAVLIKAVDIPWSSAESVSAVARTACLIIATTKTSLLLRTAERAFLGLFCWIDGWVIWLSFQRKRKNIPWFVGMFFGRIGPTCVEKTKASLKSVLTCLGSPQLVSGISSASIYIHLRYRITPTSVGKTKQIPLNQRFCLAKVLLSITLPFLYTII